MHPAPLAHGDSPAGIWAARIVEFRRPAPLPESASPRDVALCQLEHGLGEGDPDRHLADGRRAPRKTCCNWGRRYQARLASGTLTYRDEARQFGGTRAEVCQCIAP